MPARNQINRAAQGFLDLFRAKVGGQTPDELLTEVRSTLDIAPFTQVGLLRGATATATGNPPANLNISIPPGKLWAIQSISLSLSSTLVTCSGAVFALQINGLPDADGTVTDIEVGVAAIQTKSSCATVSDGNVITYNPWGKLILPGGCNIQGQYVIDDTGANYTATIGVIYSLLAV